MVYRSQGTWCSVAASTAIRSLSQTPTSSQVLHHSLSEEEVFLSAGTSPAVVPVLTLFRGVDSYAATAVLPRHKRLHNRLQQVTAKNALVALGTDRMVVIR